MRKQVTISTFEGEVTYELASFGDRFLARILDVIIIFIPAYIIPLISQWLYWSLMQSSESQATVGQKALGIMVVDVDGNKVSFGQATGRFFGNILNLLTLSIGYFMFFFNEKQQCLHDLVSGTLVVRAVAVNNRSEFVEEYIEPEASRFNN